MLKKMLVLIRHGHAVQVDKDTPSDFDRALTDRGRAEAAETGRQLAGKLSEPMLILASAALRTSQTAQMVAQAMGADSIQYKKDLYECRPEDWIREIHTTQEGMATQVFIGHNPTISSLASRLSNRKIELGTGQFMVFVAEGKWGELMDEQWQEVPG